VVLGRTVELAEIPAPTGGEDARRERVRSWWRRDGWADVRSDEAGNLWARVRAGDDPAVIVAAHLDTVFDDTVDHRCAGPGTGCAVPAWATTASAWRPCPRSAPSWPKAPGPRRWIDTSPLGAGLGCAAATIAGWEGVGCDEP
jgi:hypothetical protein